jgi:hypothetical protein
MLRALFASMVTLAIAGPALADDMDACRDRQTEAKARLDACEKVIAAGEASGQDLAIADGAATTSGRPRNTSSSPSPMARRPGGKIFISLRGSERHPEVRALARLEGWPHAPPFVILRGSPKPARTSG